MRTNLYFLFSITFLFCIIFWDFIFQKDVFIFLDAGADTYNSYFPILDLLNSYFQNFQVPFWTENIGTGTSILSVSIQLFDPFNWLLFLFGSSNIAEYFIYIFFLKIILSAFLFKQYLKFFNISEFSSSIAALYYAFTSYMILWGQHYQFATAVFFLALILYSYERALKTSKYFLFAFSVGLSAAFSLYFFLFYSVFLVIYTILRSVSYDQSPKYINFFKLFLYGLLGLSLFAFLILPSAYILTSSPRVGAKAIPNIFETLDYGQIFIIFLRLFSTKIPVQLNIHPSEWWNYYEYGMLYVGILPLVLASNYILIAKRTSKFIFSIVLILIIYSVVFKLIPSMMNGFAAINMRWLLISYPVILLAAAKSLDHYLYQDSQRNKKLLFYCLPFIFLTIYLAGLIYLANKINISSALTYDIIRLMRFELLVFILAAAIVPFLIWKKKIKLAKILILLIVLAEVYFSAFELTNKRDLITKEKYQVISERINSLEQDLNKLDPKDLYRASNIGDGHINGSMLSNYKGISYFISLGEPAYVNFLEQHGLPYLNKYNPNVKGVPFYRRALQDYLGTKYYISNSKLNEIGLAKRIQNNSYYIYENLSHTSLIKFYTSYVKNDVFSSYLPNEKDWILHQSLVLDFVSNFVKNNLSAQDTKNLVLPNFSESDVGEIKKTQNIKIINSGFPNYLKVEPETKHTFFVFELPIKDYEQYLKFKISSSDKTTIKIFLRTKEEKFQKLAFETLLNVQEKNDLQVKIPAQSAFAMIQINGQAKDVILENVKLISYTKENYQADHEKYRALIKKNQGFVLSFDQFKDDQISFNIETAQAGIANLIIPYNPGWKAKVNNLDIETFPVNNGFIGLELPPGKHQVKLRFQPVYLRQGILISLASLLLLGILLITKHKNT